ncbi:MAG: SBBP repeat-containing protein, partial [Bacteroidota bacterium]|nr:SBBP repeat-containing protein [Bacteroidota bacterium]
MKKFITFLIVFISIFRVHAQPPDFIWANNIEYSSPSSGLDNSFVTDPSGNIYRIGHFIDTVDFDPGPGTYNLISKGQEDIFVIKLNSSGALVWAKSMGGSNYDIGTSIAVDENGFIYLSGYFYDSCDFDPGPGISNLVSAGFHDAFISKLDPSGNFLWCKKIGGSGYDDIRSIVLDSAGSIYLTGVYRNTVDFDPGVGVYLLTGVMYNDFFICKLDNSGAFLWARGFGGPKDEVAYCIAVNTLGETYCVGAFKGTVDFDPGVGTYSLTSASAGTEDDLFYCKLDASGNFLWAKQIGGGDIQYGYSLAIDQGGNLLSTGIFRYTVDFNPGAGVDTLSSPTFSQNMYVLKLDPSGNFVWVKGVSSNGIVNGYDIMLDENDNIYTTGLFCDTTDFDPGPGVYTLDGGEYSTAFLWKLNPSGNLIWALPVGTGGCSFGQGIVLYGNSIYMTGCFNLAVDFDPGADIYELYSHQSSYRDIFFLKLQISPN